MGTKAGGSEEEDAEELITWRQERAPRLWLEHYGNGLAGGGSKTAAHQTRTLELQRMAFDQVVALLAATRETLKAMEASVTEQQRHNLATESNNKQMTSLSHLWWASSRTARRAATGQPAGRAARREGAGGGAKGRAAYVIKH